MKSMDEGFAGLKEKVETELESISVRLGGFEKTQRFLKKKAKKMERRLASLESKGTEEQRRGDYRDYDPWEPMSYGRDTVQEKEPVDQEVTEKVQEKEHVDQIVTEKEQEKELVEEEQEKEPVGEADKVIFYGDSGGRDSIDLEEEEEAGKRAIEADEAWRRVLYESEKEDEEIEEYEKEDEEIEESEKEDEEKELEEKEDEEKEPVVNQTQIGEKEVGKKEHVVNQTTPRGRTKSMAARRPVHTPPRMFMAARRLVLEENVVETGKEAEKLAEEEVEKGEEAVENALKTGGEAVETGEEAEKLAEEKVEKGEEAVENALETGEETTEIEEEAEKYTDEEKQSWIMVVYKVSEEGTNETKKAVRPGIHLRPKQKIMMYGIPRKKTATSSKTVAQEPPKKRGRPRKIYATLQACTPKEKRKCKQSKWQKSPFMEGKTDEIGEAKKRRKTNA